MDDFLIARLVKASVNDDLQLKNYHINWSLDFELQKIRHTLIQLESMDRAIVLRTGREFRSSRMRAQQRWCPIVTIIPV